MLGVAVRGSERVSGKLKAAGDDIKRGTEKSMRQATLLVRGRLVQSMTAPERRDSFWGKVGAATGLSVRSGKTRASLTPGTRVYRTGTTVVGVVGSREKHLRLHEDGGVVRGGSPKGYLRIPTAQAQTAAGVDRWAGRSSRDIPGAFLMKSKRGNLWVAVSRGGKLVLLYLLKKSVKMKARRVFARARDASREDVKRATADMVTATVRKANA